LPSPAVLWTACGGEPAADNAGTAPVSNRC
jgi:hypothetical protein